MKKYITLSLFIFLSLVLRAQTYVSGFISANTTWTVAGSPYFVVGNTLLSHGYRLTIEPLVVVKFDTNKVLQIDGELIAIGRPGERITFTSLQASPNRGDWGKIHFADACVDAVFDVAGHYVSGSIMKYCDVIYGGSLGFGEIHIEGSSPYISQCSIMHSYASGIYCKGKAYLLDSSVVNDCTDYGLFFSQTYLNSCGLAIIGDTIENNLKGGIYLEDGRGCSTLIKNNYFISNAFTGAIWIVNDADKLKIAGNYFINNSSNYGGIGMGIVTYRNSSNASIEKNYFINNSILNGFGGIITCGESYTDTIECNVFLHNQTAENGYGCIRLNCNNGAFIRNNIFDNNYCNGSINTIAVASIFCRSNNDSIFFENNTIKNNSAPSNICCQFYPWQYSTKQLLYIDHNNFINNTANSVIKITVPTTTTANNILYMKYNSFMDINSQYELNNNIPYGTSNLYADSNYWGSTNTQHIDSVIYDFFDYGNLSVVYYQPILTSPVVIDTTCPASIITIIAEEKNNDVYSKPFPNPFSTYTTIRFDKPLKDASLLLYNVFGQKVKTIEAINAKEITVSRDGLADGIYIYQVVEKGNRIGSGKLVVD